MSNKEKKGRIWATVGYEDSLPMDWLEKLEKLCVPTYISPLHDMDMDEKGNIKKPHLHFCFIFSGSKTESAVEKLVERFSKNDAGKLGCIKPMLVADKSAYLRYLCHLDTPNKAPYEPSLVRCVNTSKSYLEVIEDTTSSRYEILSQIVEYVATNGCSYAGLINYAFDHNKYEWVKALDANSRLISEYIRSMYMSR